MKRFLVPALGLLALTGPAVAVQTATVGRADGAYCRPDWGGEHQLTLQGHAVPGLPVESPFQSFRIETGAAIGSMPGRTYEVTLSDRVMPSGDALTSEVAYLYQSFIKKALVANYDYARGPGRETSARALQAGMLSVRGVDGSLLDLLNADPQWYPLNSGLLECASVQAFIAEAEDSGWVSIGEVWVLNLSLQGEDEPPADDQDMLVLLVPAPGAVALGAAGLGILGWFRRWPGIRSAE